MEAEVSFSPGAGLDGARVCAFPGQLVVVGLQVVDPDGDFEFARRHGLGGGLRVLAENKIGRAEPEAGDAGLVGLQRPAQDVAVEQPGPRQIRHLEVDVEQAFDVHGAARRCVERSLTLTEMARWVNPLARPPPREIR